MAEIVLEHLWKTYSMKGRTVEAVKDVSLEIQAGDIYGIIGMSGAGKSTLVRCMNFLEIPDRGRVLIDGRALGELAPRELRRQREKIGMIFQHFNLLMQKNVLDNICFPMRIQGKGKKEAKKRAEELLELVGLQEKSRAFPAQLSGGQKQRVAIARALASEPEILLCDEATSALDPQTTTSILELLGDINRRFGITIVIITHQMEVVREICSHVAVMSKGEIVEQGRVSELFGHPVTQEARELVFRDTGSALTGNGGAIRGRITSGRKIRLVFAGSSVFEPVISNLILTFGEAVNILKADVKNVGGKAAGEMILELPAGSANTEEMKQYLREKGLEPEEVEDYVEQ